MKVKKILKFFAIGIISLSLLAVALSVGLNYFVNKQLPKIIEEKNDTNYNFEYKDIEFSIFNNTLSINGVKLSPKNLEDNPTNFHYKATINSIAVSGVNFRDLLINKNLNAFTIHIIEPDIVVYKNKIKKSDVKTHESKLPGSIDIDKITLEKANLNVYNSTADTLLNSVFNLNAKIEVLKMGDYIKSKDLPFTYSDYEFSVDSVFSKLNDIQFVKANAIRIDKSNFDMVNFRILPAVDATTFKNVKKNSKSRLEIIVPKVNLKGTDWGIENNSFYLKLAQVNIDSIDFHILDKHKQNNLTTIKTDTTFIKHKMIPFHLDINELNIKKSSFKSLNTFDVQNVNITIKEITNKLNDELHIKEFILNKPKIVQIAKKSDGSHKKHETLHLNDEVKIDLIKINDASYVLKNESSLKNEITVAKFNLSLHNILVTDETVKNKIPFTYQNPILSTGKIHYDTGSFYDLYSNGIQIQNNNVTITNINLKPKFNKTVFNSKLKYGTDLFNISTGSIVLNNLNWGFDKKDIFYLKFSEVALNSINATIYRNATIPNKPGLNKLYSQKLRELKFGLDIPKVTIKNSTLVYEEETKKSSGIGKLTFKNLNANIKNIYSGYARNSGPTTTIDVSTNFMDEAKVGVNWHFNILDKSDSFNIKGTVLGLPADGMNPFIKPYLNVSATGTIDEVDFDFNGNNNTASGSFAMNYDHLKMSLYKHDGEKKRKFLSTIANLAIKKNTHDKILEHQTKPVERDKNKGFFSFFWLNLKQGLKQTFI